MKLRLDQLENQLTHSPEQQLAPVYLISGDEPFQTGRALDLIRASARSQAYTDRKVFFVDRGFDWQLFGAEQDSLSLFAERRILELRLNSARPGDAGSRVLVEYAQRPPEDTILLVAMGKLEKAQLASKWYKALEKVGIAIQVWPVDATQLPGWIHKRMQMRGLSTDAEAVRLLAERVEGNLLAADQAIEKMLLAHGPGEISLDEVAASVADSARYDVFGLVDTALSGELERALRMVHGLLDEGVEPVVINWALTRGVRETLQIALAVQSGQSVEAVLGQFHVWEKRKSMLRAAIRRRPAGFWGHLLQRAAHLDRVVKGRNSGNARDELVQLVSGISGQRPLPLLG